jgi:hypothetical protein
MPVKLTHDDQILHALVLVEEGLVNYHDILVCQPLEGLHLALSLLLVDGQVSDELHDVEFNLGGGSSIPGLVIALGHTQLGQSVLQLTTADYTVFVHSMYVVTKK